VLSARMKTPWPFLQTSDGGESWQRRFYKVYEGSGPVGSVGIDFIDAQKGGF
jgi:hypothetical protein